MIAKKNSAPLILLGYLSRLTWNPLIAVLIAITPKCPLCWAAYLSLLGLSGTPLIALSSWIAPILIALFIISLAVIGRRAFLRKSFLPLILSCLGFICVAIFFYFDIFPFRYVGLLLVLAGAVTNVLPTRNSGKPCQCSLH